MSNHELADKSVLRWSPVRTLRSFRMVRSLFAENKRVPKSSSWHESQKEIVAYEYAKPLLGEEREGNEMMANDSVDGLVDFFAGADVEYLQPWTVDTAYIITAMIHFYRKTYLHDVHEKLTDEEIPLKLITYEELDKICNKAILGYWYEKTTVEDASLGFGPLPRLDVERILRRLNDDGCLREMRSLLLHPKEYGLKVITRENRRDMRWFFCALEVPHFDRSTNVLPRRNVHFLWEEPTEEEQVSQSSSLSMETSAVSLSDSSSTGDSSSVDSSSSSMDDEESEDENPEVTEASLFDELLPSESDTDDEQIGFVAKAITTAQLSGGETLAKLARSDLESIIDSAEEILNSLQDDRATAVSGTNRYTVETIVSMTNCLSISGPVLKKTEAQQHPELEREPADEEERGKRKSDEALAYQNDLKKPRI